jgi:hypothetical protein
VTVIGRVVRDDFAKLARQFQGGVRDAVQDTVSEIEVGAKQRAPVETGALRNSIQGAMTGEAAGEVTVGEEYGAPVELGHHTRGGSFVPPQPYLTPAAEAARAHFDARVKKALK